MAFFSDMNEAKHYAQSRPYFHPIAIERARDVYGISANYPLAVDAACGTGQSTQALTAIADRVIGFDISKGMLAATRRNFRTYYLQARAESMPLPNGSVPMMTTALAFHWFDRDRFLREARRVLTVDGKLFIYNNGFTGIMRSNPAFRGWGSEVYAQRYPAPPRDSRPITEEAATRAGLILLREESYENEVSFTPEQLVAYLCTQTNVIAALEQNRESLDSATKWLLAQIHPYFVDSRATFVFRTRAWYLQKRDVP